jgi:adenylate cyclase
VFAIQDEIVEAIFAALAPALTRFERLRAARLPAPDLSAWECVQRGLHHYYRMLPDEIAAARALYERATRGDPGFALAWTALAWSHMADVMLGYASDAAASLGQALVAARRAVTLDPDDASAHAALGGAMALSGRRDEAGRSLRRALDLDPSSPMANFSYGLNVLDLEHAEEARACFLRALRLSPHDPMAHDFEGGLAFASFLAGRYDEAIEMARQSMASQGEAGFSYEPVIAASLARMGRLDEARAAATALQARYPDASLEPARVFTREEAIDQLREALALAGLSI